MSIYSHPYVYQITHPVTGEFYVGYRYANKVAASEDFGHIYKTSSKNLSHPFGEYTHAILAEFFTNTASDDAYDFEQLTIFENWNDPLLLNQMCHYGKKRWRNKARCSEEQRRKCLRPGKANLRGTKANLHQTK